MTSEIAWKIIASLGTDALESSDLAGRFFNPSVNTGLYRQFGLPLKQAYIPIALRPNTSYDDRIRVLAKEKGYEFSELKLPYSLQVPDLGSCRLLLRLRVYPPNIVGLTARFKLLDNNLSSIPFDQLFKYRNPRSLNIVYDVITWSLGLVGSSATEQKAPAIPTRLYVGFHFSDVALPQDIPAYWDSGKRQMVGLMIGHEAYREMLDDIVAKVTQKSQELNLKSTSEHLLVNKQGISFISPSGDANYMHKRRFALAMDLAEIGLVFREFLDGVYPDRRKGQAEFLDYIYRIIAAWITQWPAILSVSYGNRLLWQLLISEFALAEKLNLTEAQNPWIRAEIESASEYFSKFADRWWQAPSFAATFPRRTRPKGEDPGILI